jgi:hypothetical protein
MFCAFLSCICGSIARLVAHFVPAIWAQTLVAFALAICGFIARRVSLSARR